MPQYLGTLVHSTYPGTLVHSTKIFGVDSLFFLAYRRETLDFARLGVLVHANQKRIWRGFVVLGRKPVGGQ